MLKMNIGAISLLRLENRLETQHGVVFGKRCGCMPEILHIIE
jgi:hypothetical protein